MGWNGGRYSVAPFNPGNVDGIRGDWGRPGAIVDVMCELEPDDDDVIMTGTGCEAAAWSKLANCSGLYSVFSCFSPPLLPFMAPLMSTGFRADMLGNKCCVGVMVMDEQEARTSMRLGWVVKMGMGWEMGSSPIRIRFALSDSFSHARARSCSA